MNLVSYEFVACQASKKGVLILSEVLKPSRHKFLFLLVFLFLFSNKEFNLSVKQNEKHIFITEEVEQFLEQIYYHGVFGGGGRVLHRLMFEFSYLIQW